MVRDVRACDRDRIVLCDASEKALEVSANAPHPLSTAPAEVDKAQIEKIVDVAVFHQERTVRVALPERQIGDSKQQLRNDSRIHDTNCY